MGGKIYLTVCESLDCNVLISQSISISLRTLSFLALTWPVHDPVIHNMLAIIFLIRSSFGDKYGDMGIELLECPGLYNYGCSTILVAL